MYYCVYMHVTWYQQHWEQKSMSQALHYNTIGLKTLRFWVFKKATTTINQKYPQQNNKTKQDYEHFFATVAQVNRSGCWSLSACHPLAPVLEKAHKPAGAFSAANIDVP